jgi:hypothetical protein
MPERRRLQETELREQGADLALIEENRTLFWLSATVSFEEQGYGALMVDLVSEPLGQGHPFSYYTEGEIELKDPELQRHLRDYDPDWEFIVVLLKRDGLASVYCESRPPIGWETELRTLTPYQMPDNES